MSPWAYYVMLSVAKHLVSPWAQPKGLEILPRATLGQNDNRAPANREICGNKEKWMWKCLRKFGFLNRTSNNHIYFDVVILTNYRTCHSDRTKRNEESPCHSDRTKWAEESHRCFGYAQHDKIRSTWQNMLNITKLVILTILLCHSEWSEAEPKNLDTLVLFSERKRSKNE